MAERSRVRGDTGFRRVLSRLPDEVRDGMADLLDDFGNKLLAQMKADVPVATGFLKSRLSKRLARRSLLLRVGFVGKGSKKMPTRRVTRVVNGRRWKAPDQFVGHQFYGRFVEFGRKAQTVTVTRRAIRLRMTGNNKKNGGAREITYKSGVYQMRVRAMAARPFIFKRRSQMRSELRARLSNYWGHVLAAAAVGGSDGI